MLITSKCSMDFAMLSCLCFPVFNVMILVISFLQLIQIHFYYCDFLFACAHYFMYSTFCSCRYVAHTILKIPWYINHGTYTIPLWYVHTMCVPWYCQEYHSTSTLMGINYISASLSKLALWKEYIMICL